MNNLGITRHQIEFLKELQHELLTQDTICQASPRFWIVQGTVKEYGIDSNYDCNGSTLVHTEEWTELAESMDEIYEYLTNEFDCIDNYTLELTDDNEIIVTDKDDVESAQYLTDLNDVADFMNEVSKSEYHEVCHYKNVDKNYENTMFLTNRECKAHIKSNYYHYPKDAHSYAMTAWRSPEVAKVWDILETINCDKLLELVTE